jgi:hypothetical protein
MGLILKIHPKIHCTTIIQNGLLNSCDKSLMFYLKNIDSRNGAIPPLLMDKCKIDPVSLLKRHKFEMRFVIFFRNFGPNMCSKLYKAHCLRT